MATSLLDKFNKIDRTRISAAAAEVLEYLKKETKNFTKVTADIRKEFNTLYERITTSKPQAIKGTDEYKAYSKKESSSKIKKKNLPKEVTNKYKNSGVDIERDSERKAKPFGARVRGENKYKKPTAADYKAGNVYYEYRANRADVRRKAPHLEDGGAIDQYKKHSDEHHRLD